MNARPAKPAASARIGPNALIQTVAALTEQVGTTAARRILAASGRDDLLERRPDTMVDEREFIDLIAALRGEMGDAVAARILARSGELTAGYIVAHRIPRPARVLLPRLPRRLALRLMLRAIGAHAWTFAGSGRFGWVIDAGGATLELADCPEARSHSAPAPDCAYYRACFESLLRALVDDRIAVRETACTACGGHACVFAVALPR